MSSAARRRRLNCLWISSPVGAFNRKMNQARWTIEASAGCVNRGCGTRRSEARTRHPARQLGKNTPHKMSPRVRLSKWECEEHHSDHKHRPVSKGRMKAVVSDGVGD